MLSGFTNQQALIKISKNDFSEEFLPNSNQGCLGICQVEVHIPHICTEGSALGCEDQWIWKISMNKEAESHPFHAKCWEFWRRPVLAASTFPSCCLGCCFNVDKACASTCAVTQAHGLWLETDRWANTHPSLPVGFEILRIPKNSACRI